MASDKQNTKERLLLSLTQHNLNSLLIETPSLDFRPLPVGITVSTATLTSNGGFLSVISATPVSSNLAAISSTVIGPLHSGRSSSDVLPSGTESPASRGEETLFLFLAQVVVELLLVQSRDTEQHDQEDDDEDSEESELRPEVDDTEEGEIDGDAVEEGADDCRRADEVTDRVVVALRPSAAGFGVLSSTPLSSLPSVSFCSWLASSFRLLSKPETATVIWATSSTSSLRTVCISELFLEDCVLIPSRWRTSSDICHWNADHDRHYSLLLLHCTWSCLAATGTHQVCAASLNTSTRSLHLQPTGAEPRTSKTARKKRRGS